MIFPMILFLIVFFIYELICDILLIIGVWIGLIFFLIVDGIKWLRKRYEDVSNKYKRK
jgi:hypothetical protein